MHTADLLIDSTGPIIQHRSGITAPDDFIYLKPDDAKATVFFDAREYDIQKKKLAELSNGVQIERIEPYLEKAAANHSNLARFAKILEAIFEQHNIDAVRIPGNTPYEIVQFIEMLGMAIEVYDFSSERLAKTATEIEYLKQAQVVVESGFDLVKEVLSDADIDGGQLIYNDEILTSEWLKQEVQVHFLRQGYTCPDGLIIASGQQGACPHDEGSGPLHANQAIVVDMFPRSQTTGYYADMTRTFCKGEPSPELVKQYEAVLAVQEEAAEMVKPDVLCSDVHQYCTEQFKILGYSTNSEEGFTHSTGHGIGLALHEAPRLGTGDTVLAPGMAVTVEPGLYYKKVGGVRIEDVVVLHPDGTPENINGYSKEWIIP